MISIKAILTAGIITFSFCLAANAEHECGGRMERASTPVKNQGVFKMAASPTQHFEHWKREFINPTACRMALCNGACGASGNGCTLQHRKCNSPSESCH
jgi:hypothetical protein